MLLDTEKSRYVSSLETCFAKTDSCLCYEALKLANIPIIGLSSSVFQLLQKLYLRRKFWCALCLQYRTWLLKK